MFNNIKAAIFDLDGTLIDSMWVWDKIDTDFLNKRNLLLPSDLRENIEHLSFIDTAKYFKQRFNLIESIDEIIKEWNSMAYDEYAYNIPLKSGAKEYLKSLKLNGIKVALATSNSVPLLEAVLKTREIYEYFDVITTTDEVKRGKNFPDIYLLSAKKLKVNPSECIVFEDLLPAVQGAKQAGMKVIAVNDLYSQYQKTEILNLADHYIYNYDDLNNVS